MTIRITSLPPEVLSNIHQHVMDSSASRSGEGQKACDQGYAPLTREQAARRAAEARKSWTLANRTFHDVDRLNLSRRKNGDTGCRVTKKAVEAVAGSPAFKEHIVSLFERSAHIEVDFSTISEDEGRIVLDALRQRVRDGAPVLHNLRFGADLDVSSPSLMAEIDALAAAIRATGTGEETSLEFACRSHDEERADPPDVSAYRALTSVDFSGCSNMRAPPDFSANRELRTVDFSYCESMRGTPDFSNNPRLATADFTGCDVLLAGPDFSQNPELTSIRFAWCRGLTTAPDFSRNPELIEVDFSTCERLREAPDFAKNAKLTSVNFSHCRALREAPDFTANPMLATADFSGCEGLTAPPDFSGNPRLVRADFSYCDQLGTPPVFARNSRLMEASPGYWTPA